MNATLIQRQRLVVPLDVQQWADEFVQRAYRMRLERAGSPVDDCRLCHSRRPPDAHISDPCDRCGLVEERETDRERVARETRVLVPYAVPAIDDETIPF